MQFREMLRDEHEEGRLEGLRDGRLEGLRDGRLEGLKEGRLDSIRELMKNLQLTSEQAMAALGLSAEEQKKYRGMI